MVDGHPSVLHVIAWRVAAYQQLLPARSREGQAIAQMCATERSSALCLNVQ